MTGFDLTAWLADTAGVGTPAAAPETIPNASTVPTSTVHGANALAAAVVAGDQITSKPELQGMELKNGKDVYDIDGPRETNVPQLQVAPITITKTEFRLQVVHQIATNSTYICYSLKAGHLRVLNKSTTNRALYKGHNSMVVDMKFCNVAEAANMLASCDQAGELFVRKIVEQPEEPVITSFSSSSSCMTSPITEEILVHHKMSTSEKATRRLAWHPTIAGLLAVVSTDRISLVNIPPTMGVASSPEFAAPYTPDFPVTSGLITSIAFNEAGDLLAAADDAGFVYVWSISPAELACAEEGGQALQPLSCDPDIKFRAYDDGEYAATLDFLPSKTAKSLLVLGSSTARILKLWSVHLEGRATCTYTLELSSSKDGPSAFFNHMLVQPDFSAVVLANAKRQQVYVVHFHQDTEKDVTSFDYISEFSVRYPIMSMSTPTETFNEDGALTFHLYCVQTEAIQQYTLYPELCYPSPPELDASKEVPAAAETTADLAIPTPKLFSPSSLLKESAEQKVGVVPPTIPEVALLASSGVEAPPLGGDADAVKPAVSLPLTKELLRDTVTQSVGLPLTKELLAANTAAVSIMDGVGIARSHPLEGKFCTGSSETSDAASPYADGTKPNGGDVANLSEQGSTAAPDKPAPTVDTHAPHVPPVAPTPEPVTAPTTKRDVTSASHAPPPSIPHPTTKSGAPISSHAPPPSMPPPPSDLLKKRMSSSPASTPSPSIAGGTAAAPATSSASVGSTASAATKLTPSQKKKKAGGVNVAAAPLLPPQPSSELVVGAGLPPPAAAAAAATTPAVARPAAAAPSAAPAVTTAATTAAATTAAATTAPAAATAGATKAANASGSVSNSELVSLFASQTQILNQIISGQQETIKQLKSELARQAKATEQNMSRAVETVVKAQNRVLERMQIKATEDTNTASRERGETSRALLQLNANLVKTTQSVQESTRAASASAMNLGPVVTKAVSEALPIALGGSASQQALGKVMSTQLRASLPQAVSEGVKEAFTAGGVVASFEAAAKLMFSQIDSAFRSGMATHLQEASCSTSDIATSMKDTVEQMRSLVQKLASQSSTPAPAGLSADARGQPAPAAKVDPKVHMTSLLRQGSYEAAFDAALSTMDVSTTLWLCKQCNPITIFATEPCPLSQAVLLSLISHLGQDLNNETDLKLKWIGEAAPTLDPKGEHFVKHARGFLEPIKLQLAALAKSSTGDTARVAKTTVHVVNSLLHQ